MDKKLKNHFRKHQVKYILSIFILLFFIFNIHVSTSGYHRWDVNQQQSWGSYALINGISSLYETGITDYPPVYNYVLQFDAGISALLFKDITPLSTPYMFIYKIFPILCLLITGVIFFFYFRKKNLKLAISGMCFYIFNLSLIYNAAYWGQADSVGALFSFLSILFLIEKKYPLSTIFITLAIFTKFQSIVLLPIIGLIILLDSNFRTWIKSGLAAFFTFLFIFLPLIFRGVFWKAFWISVSPMNNFNKVTVNAFNFWNLISPEAPHYGQVLSDQSLFLGITFKQIGLFILGIYTLFVLYQLFKKRNKKTIALAAASIVFAFFMLPTQIHERHLFPFFALMLLVVLMNRKFLWVYIISSITYLLNLMMLLRVNQGTFMFYQMQFLIDFLIKIFSFKTLTIIISLINLIVFIEFSRQGVLRGLCSNIKEDFRKLI